MLSSQIRLTFRTRVAAMVALSLAGLMCALIASPTAHAQTTIDTTPSWDGSNYIYAFGEPDTATCGQTFTVGTDNVLNDFSFFTQTTDGISNYKAYVFAWDGNKAVGPQLFASSALSSPGTVVFTERR